MYEKKHALPNKKIHTPKGIARLTVTAATMAAMTGSSLISPFTAFAQTGDGGSQHPAVMSPIAAHAGAASGTGAKSAAQTIADLQKAVDEAKAKEDAAKASYDEAAGPYNEAASARDQVKASYDSAVSAGTAADRAAMDEYARQVAEGKDAADAAGKDLEQAKAGLADAKADASEKDEAYQSAIKAAQNAKDALDKAKADAIAAESLVSAAEQAKAQADAKLSKLNSIDAGAAIASGHDVNADDALNALFAAAVEARAKVAPAKAILDEKQAAVDGLQSGYDAALAAYEQAKSDRIAAEQKLSDEIARQEAKEAAKQQAAYTPKHLAGTDTAQPGNLAQTGDRAGLIGETFVIGGTVLVAAGVFLDQKKRREQM